MRRLLRIFLVLLVLVIGGVVAAALLAFQEQPLVGKTGRLSAAQVDRAVALLRANDPRRLKDGQIGQVTLADSEMALMLSHGLGRLGGESGAEVDTDSRAMAVRATVKLPRNPLARYLNVAATLEEGEPLPRVSSLRIGALPVPGWLADAVIRRAAGALHADVDARAASEMIRSVQLGPGRMQVRYRWDADTVKRLRNRLVSDADRERLRAYNDHLVRVARELERGADLSRLLTPVLKLAAEQSATHDPAAENRIALLVLESYVNGRDLGAVVPEAREWPSPRRLSPTIQGRRDFPQHFLTSAAVSALGGGALADALGVYKEIDDARGGSGFSFTDIAADRAGTRFGELAVRSDSTARAIQDAAQRGLSNADLMPPARDLPEHMAEPEFRRRFGGIDDPRYARIAREIEQRIDRLPLYQR